MNDIDVTGLVFAIPARILRPSSQRQIELLNMIKENHVLDTAILDEKTPFFFDAEISSDMVDAYSSYMTLSTLTNFMNDARMGVAFLPAHDHDELPFGRSFEASLENAVNPPRTRVVASFYTMPGLKLNDVSTDDLIGGLRSGLVKDTSVGFHGGEMTCSLCGRSIWSWDCPHIPGMRYEVESGGVVATKTATYAVDGAHLAEVSAVYDGATPRAEILKAEREASTGRLRPEAARMIEQRFRVKLPAAKRSFAGADIPQSNQKEGAMSLDELLAGVRKALALNPDADVMEAVTNAGAELQRLRPLEAAAQEAQGRVKALEGELATAQERATALEPEAADGRQYRTDLLEQALVEGVRALGDKFDKATYETLLRGASLATIKRMRDDWQAQGDARLPGGRASTDSGEPAPGKTEKPARRNTPESAHTV